MNVALSSTLNANEQTKDITDEQSIEIGVEAKSR